VTGLKAFALATLERAVKTFAQTLAAVVIADQVTSIVDADWKAYLGAAGLAALLSVLTSVASGSIGGTGPSLATESTVPAQTAPDPRGYPAA
jgi:hypothetical protein